MTRRPGVDACDRIDLVSAYVLKALPAAELASVEAHIAGCDTCRDELSVLTPVIESLSAWPVDTIHPSAALWDRLLDRIGEAPAAIKQVTTKQACDPQWEDVAPGIACKLLASDPQRDRVSMLVRLEPGTQYPAHTHSGVEELHLLRGELWIDERKLYPGDYYRAEPHSSDGRVWSETGCTCLLVTSPSDELR